MPGGVCELRHVSKLFANVVYVSQGRPDPPDRARAGPARLAGTCPRFAAGPAPLTPKTYCFASSRTLIRD
jgi:hypothetical protein